MSERDKRLTPARPDLADIALKGSVAAERYVEGRHARVVAPSAPLRRRPAPDAPLDTEALLGEPVRVFEERDGYAWVQLGTDGYVGYLPGGVLSASAPDPTHRVVALRTFVYPGPDLKLPPLSFLSFGAAPAAGEASDRGFVPLLSGGFVWAGHLAPLTHRDADFVAVAEGFAGTPYLWGGKSSLGLDCSGLVQLSLAAAGVAASRDSDQQEGELGRLIPRDTGPLRRGDLVFWRGHVGIMRDEATLLHANGWHMAVASEPLAIAEARIAAGGGGPITAVRRLPV